MCVVERGLRKKSKMKIKYVGSYSEGTNFSKKWSMGWGSKIYTGSEDYVGHSRAEYLVMGEGNERRKIGIT